MDNATKKKDKNKITSELRMDIISSDWVIIAKGRAFRPSHFGKKKEAHQKTNKKDCVFCNLGKKENGDVPLLILSHGKPLSPDGGIPNYWTLVVVKNKFPVVGDQVQSLDERVEGNLYKRMNAVGFHELVVFKNHAKKISQMTIAEVKEVFDVYQQRYLFLMKKPFVSYISIFHNLGILAGASIVHTHSQIITTPLIDKDLKNALSRSEQYFLSHQKCISCEMISWEKKVRKRVVFENEHFIAICPFASKTAFEVIISPKHHISYFEQITEKEKLNLAKIFRHVFLKLDKVLKDPDYNFYLHTSPCDGKTYSYYHWHWTILPKTSTPAGFELGTQINVVTISPEDATRHLLSH